MKNREHQDRRHAGAFLLAAAVTCCLSVAAAMPAAASSWQQDGTGWWWQRDSGGYPVSEWEWIDGNGDGVEECYYFDGNGYLVTDAVTPDGYEVNADGAWVSDGTVQTRKKTRTGVYSGVLYFNTDPTVLRVTERADGTLAVRYSGKSDDIAQQDVTYVYTRNPKYDGAYEEGSICYEQTNSDDGIRLYFIGYDTILYPGHYLADFNSANQYLTRQ